jgi:hypothetical protein
MINMVIGCVENMNGMTHAISVRTLSRDAIYNGFIRIVHDTLKGWNILMCSIENVLIYISF